MEWLNLHTSTLDSEEFLCSDPVDQATWLKLERYCIGQENGGVIHGARNWTDRQWQQLVRAKRAEVRHECSLWTWDGDDLTVKFYPVAKELEIKAKRRAAESTHAKRQGKVGAVQRAEHDAEQRAERPEKGMEGKEKEGNGKESDSRSRASCFPEPVIPSLEECIQWGQAAGVPEEWIRAKYTNTEGTHGWERNGRVILWKTLWKSWFEKDRSSGRWQKNAAVTETTERQWPIEWDGYDSEKIRGIATGAAAVGDLETIKKCRAWLDAHK